MDELGTLPKDPAELQALLDTHTWHHSIDFGNGVVSKANLNLERTDAFARALFQNISLKGHTFMDIGAWTGAYSFVASKMGARVLATDKFSWTHPQFKGRQAFELARKLLNVELDTLEIDVPDITPQSVGEHDVVLYSGVFYHLLDPIGLTHQISACAKKLLILETRQDAVLNPEPAMIFSAGPRQPGGLFWSPNPQCMYELLKDFGFKHVLYRQTPTFPGNRRGMYQAFRNLAAAKEMGVGSISPEWVSLSDPAERKKLFGTA